MSETADIQNNMKGDAGINQRLSDLREKLDNVHKLADEFKWLDSGLGEIQTIIINFLEHIREGAALIQGHHVIWANRAGCEMVGYTLEEVRKMELRDLFVPAERDKAHSMIDIMLSGFQYEHPLDWTFLRKDRTLRYIKSFGYVVNYRGKPAVEAFFYDATADRKLLDELKLRSIILDSITEIVFLLDKEGNILFVNKAGIDSSGYTKEEIFGRNILERIPMEIRNTEKIRLGMISEHKETIFDSARLCKDGSVIPIEVRVRAVKITKITYLVGVARIKSGGVCPAEINPGTG
jgi:PAS domain S-box-containing protein